MILNNEQMEFLGVEEAKYMPSEMLLLGMPLYNFVVNSRLYYLSQFDTVAMKSLKPKEAWCVFSIINDDVKEIMQLIIPESFIIKGRGSILYAADIIELQIKIDKDE